MRRPQFELSFADAVEALPEPRRIEHVPPGFEASCMVTVLGFEPRCFAAANAAANRGWRCRSAVYVRYANAEMEEPNAEHESKLRRGLERLLDGGAPTILDHDDHDLRDDFGDRLLNQLRQVGVDPDSPKSHVIFDITVGSSRLLLEGLHALIGSSVRLTLLYAESAEYRPLFEEYCEYLERQRVENLEPPEFLTLGVDQVEVLRRIPGNSADGRPTYLVVFPSFSYPRIDAVLQELSPSRVEWLFGVPHLVKNRWRLDAQRDYHGRLVERSHRHCYVSTFDYRETLTALENTYVKRKEEYGLFIASLGSKLQKVGQVLFQHLRPEVAAVVSIPRVWNPDRFSSAAPRAIYCLELGECERLRKVLWSTRTLRL